LARSLKNQTERKTARRIPGNLIKIETMKNKIELSKLSKCELAELTAYLYRIEQITGTFAHVYDHQNIINVEEIEAFRQKVQNQIDKL
jgi:hypothetical protein